MGAIGLPMLTWPGVPAPVQGTPLQMAEICGAWGVVEKFVVLLVRFESEDMRPKGEYMDVNGCSAETEKALPYGPAIV